MPIPEGTRFRFRKGTKTRLAFSPGGEVVEAKNMKTGATHTAAEFAADRKAASAKKQARALRNRDRE